MVAIENLNKKVSAGVISAKFHNTLAEILLAAAQRTGLSRVVLSGGCFQNKYLLERAVKRLKEGGFCPYWHQRIPSNDGGIALGQIAAYAMGSSREKKEGSDVPRGTRQG